MMRWLAANGVHPMVLDWGEPEPAFTLSDHIAGRLVQAMEACRQASGGQPLTLAGYCMGGTFAAAAAALRPDLVRRLILLASPWDFHAGGPPAFPPTLPPGLQLVPVDQMQAAFALADPDAVARKFRRFSGMKQDSAAARLFVAIEDWLNDGVPLSGATARECLRDWYRDNLPVRGTWQVAGQTINPATINVPVFAAVPRRDRIVQPDSALALVRLLPHVTLLEPDAGHVGMTAGAAARTVLWEAMRGWLERSADL